MGWDGLLSLALSSGGSGGGEGTGRFRRSFRQRLGRSGGQGLLEFGFFDLDQSLVTSAATICFCFEGELVEEGVFAVVRGPDGEVEAPGDAGLGGLPKELGVGVLGEFVEANIAAIDGHGIGIGGESDDAGAVIEFDVADFDFFGGGGGMTVGIEAIDFEVLFAVRDDGAGEVEELGGGVGRLNVFEGAGVIFGGKEVIALFVTEAFADVFEGVAEGPADADGFFGEGEGLFALGVHEVVGLNPDGLVGHEIFGEGGGGVDGDGGEVHGFLIFDF